MAQRKQDTGVVQEHRLYVSGLHSSIKAKEVCERFASFGSVKDGEAGVTEMGLDANGYPKTYTFLTLQATDAQLARCTSLLSGSLWKGHKLRIAPAKPDYQARMLAERELAAADLAAGKTERITKKRKRNPDPLVGEAAKRFELVTADNVKRHRGWNLETTTQTPLFALLCRPSHPLPLPPKAAPTAWTREAPKSKASKAARAILKASAGGMGVLGIKPLSRSRRVKIDVRRWGRKKVVFGVDGDGKVKKEGWWGGNRGGEWECVPVDSEDASATTKKQDQVQWIFRAKDGSVKRTEFIQLSARSVPHTDSFSALLNVIDESSTSTLPIASAPLAPSLPLISLPITFNPPSTSAASPIVITNRPRSLSPPPYVPTATKALMYNEEDTFALLAATQGEDEFVSTSRQERDAALQVLRGLLGESEQSTVEKVQGTNRKPIVEGFGEESSDEDQNAEPVLRLRGGGPPGAVEDDSDDSSDEESDATMTDAAPVEQAKTTLQMGSLKDMFKPQEEAAPFSILSSLALDLPPPSRTPSPEPFSYAAYPSADPSTSHASGAFVPPPALGGKNRSWIGTASVGSFFLYSSERFDGAEDIPELRKEAARRETEERLKSAKSFWRSESLEKIEADHTKLQESLRGQARKRHREAAKRVRKGAKRSAVIEEAE